MNEERACTNSLPPLSADSLVKSFRCCGRSPSGPPADAHGKERMALTTSFSETGVSDAASGGDGKHLINIYIPVNKKQKHFPGRVSNRRCAANYACAEVAKQNRRTGRRGPAIALIG